MSLLEQAMTKDLNRLRAALDQERERNATLTQQVERARRTLELVKADAVIGLGSEAPKMNLQKIRERVRDALNAMEGESQATTRPPETHHGT